MRLNRIQQLIISLIPIVLVVQYSRKIEFIVRLRLKCTNTLNSNKIIFCFYIQLNPLSTVYIPK